MSPPCVLSLDPQRANGMLPAWMFWSHLVPSALNQANLLIIPPLSPPLPSTLGASSGRRKGQWEREKGLYSIVCKVLMRTQCVTMGHRCRWLQSTTGPGTGSFRKVLVGPSGSTACHSCPADLTSRAFASCYSNPGRESSQGHLHSLGTGP